MFRKKSLINSLALCSFIYSFNLFLPPHHCKTTTLSPDYYEQRRIMAAFVNSHVVLHPDDVIPSRRRHKGTIIFLHPAAGFGAYYKSIFQHKITNFVFDHFKIIFPTSPFKPYTLYNGHEVHIWFDDEKLKYDSPELLNYGNDSCEYLREMVKNEIRMGTPSKRIIIGGFAQGGTMALHLTYRFMDKVAGVFALSSYLNPNSIVYKVLQEKKGSYLPPLYFSAMTRDTVIKCEWSNLTFQKLTSHGIEGQFDVENISSHIMTKKQFDKLISWIHLRIPNN